MYKSKRKTTISPLETRSRYFMLIENEKSIVKLFHRLTDPDG